MIPTHFVDRMSKTLSGWLEGEGMSESLVEEARAELAECQRLEEHARHRDAPLVAGEYAERASLLTRLADRVEELEAVLRSTDERLWRLRGLRPSLAETLEIAEAVALSARQALSPPMDK